MGWNQSPEPEERSDQDHPMLNLQLAQSLQSAQLL